MNMSKNLGEAAASEEAISKATRREMLQMAGRVIEISGAA